MSVDPSPVSPTQSSAPPPQAAPAETSSPAAPQEVSWTQQLDPDLRQEPNIGRYKTLNDFAKGFIEQRKTISQKGVVVPGPDAPPEVVSEYRKAIGVPETPAQYDMQGFEAPEGWDPAFQGRALEAFHKSGIPSSATKEVLNWYAGEMKSQQAQLAEQDQQVISQWSQDLKKTWGAALDQKLDLAERTFETLFPKGVAKQIADARLPGGGTLGDHPMFLDALAKMGEKLAEHQLLGDKSPSRFAKTPDEASAEIQRLQRDPEFRAAFTDTRHKDHQQSIEKWTLLHEQAFGTGSAEKVVSA